MAALQTRPTEVLDLTSLTMDDCRQLVPPFETAFQGRLVPRWMLAGRPAVYTLQGLRSLSKPFQSWKPNQTTMTTEVALEFVDGDASIMSFPLQPTKRHHAAGQMMPLSPLGTRLTTIQPALILAHTDDCLAWRPPPIEAADLCGGQGQALRRVGPWRRI